VAALCISDTPSFEKRTGNEEYDNGEYDQKEEYRCGFHENYLPANSGSMIA